MSNNSIRIRTTPDGSDSFLKVKIDQEFDNIEILSLKLTQEEVYRNFCADYGVVVGRVFINSGFGVENARVSIFIPIESVDKDDPLINGLYPYEVVTDKDIDGKRYNLLPKYSETDNDCFTPIGTLPNKREILDDPNMGYVYSKYYKFTTTTNHAGDYMLFGIPVGNHLVHVDADLSDIGIASQRPYDSISQGAPLQMFDSPTKFKNGTNLDKLVQIKSANAGVNVQPFWGSIDNCEIGISRIDIDLNYIITPSAIFIGGIFGDQNKNSVNKRCRPRRKMGNLCEQVTGEGTIEMIRKTMDDEIEKFDINGARLIDDNGAWAYQIPMNLDYYITDEFGDLVLSQDPNKGIPTRSSVRFKISMDDTGGLGRLRSRAKYLVPHNPSTGNPDEIDFEFGPLTKSSSFRDIYWNKIYSVSNFISRYQRTGTFNALKTRNFNAIKDVDDCVGNKNPHPFNRVNLTFNPLFFIICLIMKIIEAIISILNGIVFAIINLLLSFWNGLMGRLCRLSGRKIAGIRPLRILSFACKLLIPYIPCIYMTCPDDDPKKFAPGCTRKLNKWGYDKISGGQRVFTDVGLLSNCIAAEMAKLLNLFQFDFYNDWVNGVLFSYLLKYKKRRSREKYCKYDCSGSNCRSSLLYDTCYNGHDSTESIGIRDGLIKKYNGELFYAPCTKTANNKLYATELINLGAVFPCDWQGVPKIQEYLVPTTYVSPPIIDEFDEETETTLITGGQVDIGPGFGGVFFDINCAGLKSDKRQCLNLRHACEIGIDIDERDEDINNVDIPADHIIGLNELNTQYGGYVRDVFFGLNNVTGNLNVTFNYNTAFNLQNLGGYNFASTVNNGVDYIEFRGVNDDSTLQQPKHSYFFYFGLIPGATGLDKMNANFFTRCFPKIELEFLIKIVETGGVTPIANGFSTFTIISGTGPFTATISGPNGYLTTVVLPANQPTTTLTNLAQGQYLISVVDANGLIATQTFEILGPLPLYGAAFASGNNTATASPFNGEITLLDVGGGSGSYQVTLYNSSGSIAQILPCNTGSIASAASNPLTITQTPVRFCGLPVDNGPRTVGQTTYHGYYIIITDLNNTSSTVELPNLVVYGITPLTVSQTIIPVTCYDGDDGGVVYTVTGGVEPYFINTFPTNTPDDDTNSFAGLSANTLSQGNYTTTFEDSSSPALTYTTTFTLGSLYPEMKLELIGPTPVSKQCDPLNHHLIFRVVNGGTNINGQNYTTAFQTNPTYQLRYDENEDAEGNPIWNASQTITYNPSLGDPYAFEVLVPVQNFASELQVRLSSPNGACGSDPEKDGTDFSKLEIRTPLVSLYGDITNVNNSNQCQVGAVSIKFNISHLLFGDQSRKPYTIEYRTRTNLFPTFTPWRVYGTQTSPSAPIIPIPINNNQQLITLQLVGSPSTCNVEIRITDNVGCQSPPFSIGPISLPQNTINAVWQSDPAGNNPNGNPMCNKKLVVSGGLPPYTKTDGYALYDATNATTIASTTYYVFCNQTLTTTFRDSAGCVITISS